jgi:hypothetical protein
VSVVLTMNRMLPGKFDAAPMAVEDVRPAIFPGVAEMHSLIAMVLASDQRERTMWLATCAARSAIAFGTSVIDRYVGVLAAAAHATR